MPLRSGLLRPGHHVPHRLPPAALRRPDPRHRGGRRRRPHLSRVCYGSRPNRPALPRRVSSALPGGRLLPGGRAAGRAGLAAADWRHRLAQARHRHGAARLRHRPSPGLDHTQPGRRFPGSRPRSGAGHAQAERAGFRGALLHRVWLCRRPHRGNGPTAYAIRRSA
eukprot:scaffold7566_cov122-Isochrysis_galbana.AAC.6